VAWLLILLLAMLLAPLFAPYNPYDISFAPLSSPSSAHWLGVNDGGIDILSELLYGLHHTARFGLLAGSASLILGVLIGLISGWFGGLTDLLWMRLADTILAIPTIMLLILTSVFLEPSPFVLALLLAALTWPGTARIIRSQTLLCKQQLHIGAVRQMGGSSGYIITCHLLPELYPLAMIGLIGKLRMAIFMEASLAYLGLFSADHLSLGLSIRSALEFYYLDSWWHWLLPPVICLALLLLIPTLIGVRLEREFNPRLPEVVQ